MKCQTQLETMANEDASINSFKQRKSKTERTPKEKNEHTQNKEVLSKECHKCGFKHGNNKCYAKGKRCAKCQNLNHFARVCCSQSDAKNRVHLEVEKASDDELFVGCITSIDIVELSEWYEELTVQNKAVKFQLDTGAKCSILPYKVMEDLGIQCDFEKTQIKLKSYSGHQIPTRGVVTLPCEHKGNVYNVQFHVVEVEAPAVLSAQTCKEMGLLVRIHQLQDSQPKEQHCIPECPTVANQNVLHEYSDLFQGLGCISGEHTIKVDPSIPSVVHPPRKVPVSLKDKIKDELDHMEQTGVIVRQPEPTDWVNSMVAVVKPNKIRICIDPRDLNKVIQREHLPMLTIEVVTSMPQAKVFSVLDATSGY